MCTIHQDPCANTQLDNLVLQDIIETLMYSSSQQPSTDLLWGEQEYGP